MAKKEDNPEAMKGDLGHSYLLRGWAERNPEKSATITWRYSLKDLSTRAQRGFANLEALLTFLERLENRHSSSAPQNQADGE
jgi:hypothetical protein